MKKFCIIIFSLFLFMAPVSAKEKVPFYLFYGEGCPHCAHEKEWLETIQDKYTNVHFEFLETWYNEENYELYQKVKKAYQLDKDGVPLTIIGDKYFYGFNDYTIGEITKVLDECSENACTDYVTKIQAGEEVSISKAQEIKPTIVTKLKVETRKTFFDHTIFYVGAIVVLAILFGIVLINHQKGKKNVD